MNTDRFMLGVPSSKRTVAASLVVLAAMLVVPFVTTSYYTGLAMTALVFLMLGVSWNLLAGYAGQISLGHAAFFGLGAYVAAWLTTPSAAGLPAIPFPLSHPVVALVLGGVGAALVALVTGPVMFRLRGHYFAIGTLALAAIIRLILTDQRSISGGSTGYYLNAGMGEIPTYLLTVVVAALATIGVYLVVNSRLGLGMRAIHDDETAASGLGVDPLRYKMYAFLISAFVAGLAGAAYALNSLYINPTSTLAVTWTVDTLVIVILGGMGTVAGPLFGTVIFMIIDNGLASVLGGLATTVEGIIIILVVIFLPNGIYGYLKSYVAQRREGDTATSS
ncbi:branched-chain amino acid transport system permease protein [Halarchaeum rubridurum]|uniref:Branched-chain amino acid ABC transporter permease n=1 Tax=Halarchaeum rubridurum TaxID=489911 RepID=A0A830FXM0_9EURY|nr:branched-chain amino acid ABC transporter permease [Halarchaeum rubridurum]MBP1954435.1 branched-chain amino acid transport system permease protein [Halarchaeum rubridurum]GGM60980.1 branched-chain amino acid ABC transporter permease [Halarchaeum rubridurum]